MAENNIGKITQVIGAVIDIKFTDGNLPEINSAINIKTNDGGKLVVEVAQHLGDAVGVLDVGKARFGGEVDDGRVVPQRLEAIVLARLGLEHVHDEAAVVQKRPRAVLRALAMQRLHLRLRAHRILDLVDDGLHLTVVGGRGDDEVVRHADEVAHLLHHDVGGLLLVGRAGRDEGAFPRSLLGRRCAHAVPFSAFASRDRAT